MKIINRYVLKEHVGPFVFALSALTSLLLLQYIARKFGDLVGKGLSWSVITEFMLLSIPFTLAETLPMAMLVAVLYAFSRLASENEITALKAGGVSTRGLMRPAIAAATGLAMFMLWFNDQILPRANHELATLTTAIAQTKPTFALRPQVINTIKESQLYLRAGRIDEGTGLMTDVTIYDVTDPARRNTIYADSGKLALNPNMRDMTMRLFTGIMMSAPSNQPGQLNRVYYHEALRKVRDVAGQFQSIDADSTSKSDREMSVCEMQRLYEKANASIHQAELDSVMAAWRIRNFRGDHVERPALTPATKAGGIGALYCGMITRFFHVKELNAAEVPRQDTTHRVTASQHTARQDTTRPDTARRDTTRQDTTHRDTTKRDTTKRARVAPGTPVTPVTPGIPGIPGIPDIPDIPDITASRSRLARRPSYRPGLVAPTRDRRGPSAERRSVPWNGASPTSTLKRDETTG